MPRAKVIRTSEFPYHLSTRTNNRDFVHISMTEFWDICLKNLSVLDQKYRCVIHQFVLMTNHYHLMMSTPESNVSEAMEYFNRQVAKDSNLRSARINHLFGGRYKPTLITHESHYWNCVKYIFRNPVRAGICKSVADYPYSSLNSPALGFDWKMTDFFNDKERRIQIDLDWLDQPSPKEVEEGIRKGLKRSQFKMPRGPSGHQVGLDVVRYKKVDATF